MPTQTSINVTQQDIKQIVVDPIILSGGQLDAIIASLIASGIASNYPLNSSNLQSVSIMRLPDGTFCVNITPLNS